MQTDIKLRMSTPDFMSVFKANDPLTEGILCRAFGSRHTDGNARLLQVHDVPGSAIRDSPDPKSGASARQGVRGHYSDG